MNKLKAYPFSQLYEMASGISTTKDQAGHGSPFVSFSTVFNNYFLPNELPDLMETSSVEQEKYSVKKGDVFITRTSETIDELAMSCVALKDYPCATYSGFTKRLRPKKENQVYPKYIAFYLRSKLFRKAVTNNAFMTLRASFNEDIFSFLTLYLPDYEVQKKIGDLLFSIEENILVNNAICSELEQMAKLIYDYWFVQFDFPDENGNPYRTSGGTMEWNDQLKREIPKGWGAGNLQQVGVIVSGGTPSTKREDYYTKEGVAWITPNDLSKNKGNLFIDHGERDITKKGLDNSSATLMPKGSVLLSSRAPIGYLAIAMNEISTNQGFKSIVPKYGYHEYYIYYLLKSSVHAITQQGAGTTFKEVSKDMLSDFMFALPPVELAAKFVRTIKSMCDKRQVIELENKELTKLRDWLLPMLMNGQVTVE